MQYFDNFILLLSICYCAHVNVLSNFRTVMMGPFSPSLHLTHSKKGTRRIYLMMMYTFGLSKNLKYGANKKLSNSPFRCMNCFLGCKSVRTQGFFYE